MQSVDDRVTAYRESIERLTSGIAKLRAEQKRLKWVLVATIVVAPVLWLVNHTVSFLVAVGGVSMFFVGHYVVYMHIHEDKLTIANARRRIKEIENQSKRAVPSA